MLSFVRNRPFSEVAAGLHSHQQWPPLVLFLSWISSHSNRCVVMPHWLFSFAVSWCEAPFYVLICHLYVTFDEVSVKVFGHFSKRLFCSCWVLRVFYTFFLTVLYQMFLLQIFSSTLWLVFSFSWQCLSESRSFVLIKSSSSVISFMAHAFSVPLRRLYIPKSRFSPMLSLWNINFNFQGWEWF